MRASASFAIALSIFAAAIQLPRRQLGGLGGILPTGILPTDVLPTGILPTGVLPTGVLPTGVLPTDVLPTGVLPTGVLPTGVLPTGVLPTGILPTGVLPTGVLPTGVLPTDVLPTGILPTGILPTGILPTGILPTSLPIGPSDNCNTGSALCCTSTETSSPTILSALSGILGTTLPDISGLIGVSCSGLDIIGVGGNSCSQQPVCCSDNSFNGVIALGCSPLNINV
ncbi:fungal hydrophobin-domain-containing protein [Flammula alnicola]|nr:fungal hydrophobin-domain-containing protein [Flammula alnicola]